LKKLDSHFLGLGEFPALVVVDMCKAFIDPSSPLGFECSKLIDANVKLVQEFRNRNFPIFFTTTIYRNESEASVFRKKIPALNILKPNSNEVSFLEELSPISNEVLIEKKFASAFFQTNLSLILDKTNIDSLVVSGVTTSGCVRATALDSLQHNFLTIIAEDCVGDRDDSAHKSNLIDLQLKYADVMHSDEIFN
tara:strand:+ start:568 stop:1149 length:582 start_codon:yes stop_codon:yes gene_type:complete